MEAPQPRERSGLEKAIAQQIRAERAAAKLTVEETAKRARIPYSTYRKLDNGVAESKSDQLERLCSRVYGIRLSEFFARVEARLAAQADDGPTPPNG